MTTGYLGLGSNLGDRLEHLQRAVDLLAAEPALRVTASSRVWESDPVGGPDQPDYLNVVLRVETDGDPPSLLAAARKVETSLGRVRDERWGPRTIDVDVLLFGRVTTDDPELTIPHPRMLERAFVLLPLLELWSDPVLPDGTRVLDVALDVAGARLFAPPLRLP